MMSELTEISLQDSGSPFRNMTFNFNVKTRLK